MLSIRSGVERRHKILLAKIAGGLGILAVGLVGWLYNAEQSRSPRSDRNLRSIVIQFVPDSAYALDWLRDTTSEFRYRTSQLSYNLCNNGRRRVTYVEFYPLTMWAGRSTQYDVNAQPNRLRHDPLRFTADFIIDPDSCVNLSWKGSFVLFDSVFARPTMVRVAEN